MKTKKCHRLVLDTDCNIATPVEVEQNDEGHLKHEVVIQS